MERRCPRRRVPRPLTRRRHGTKDGGVARQRLAAAAAWLCGRGTAWPRGRATVAQSWGRGDGPGALGGGTYLEALERR